MLGCKKLCSYVRIPLVTGCCVFICTAVYLVNLPVLLGWKHKHFCLNAHEIIRSRQVYRVFIHTFVHKGPWHLAVTMIPMLLMGTIIEKHYGSILFLLFVIICWVISTTLEVSMATLLYHTFHSLFHGCSLGFSGIVFGLMVLLSEAESCRKYGHCLPLNLLPWLSLVIYYVGFHRGAIFAHIGGIITGYAYKSDVFSCCLPSPQRLAEWEHSHQLKCLVRLPVFARFSHVVPSNHNRFEENEQHLDDDFV